MTEETKAQRILRKVLTIVRILLYIPWVMFLLFWTWWVCSAAYSGFVITETDIYMEFNPYIYALIFGILLSVAHLETGLVLLRKYSKILGIIHIVLGIICIGATLYPAIKG